MVQFGWSNFLSDQFTQEATFSNLENCAQRDRCRCNCTAIWRNEAEEWELCGSRSSRKDGSRLNEFLYKFLINQSSLRLLDPGSERLTVKRQPWAGRTSSWTTSTTGRAAGRRTGSGTTATSSTLSGTTSGWPTSSRRIRSVGPEVGPVGVQGVDSVSQNLPPSSQPTSPHAKVM